MAMPATLADGPRAKSHGGYLHTCADGDPKGLPFGRKAPDTCARCWEMVNAGAPRRSDYGAGRRDRGRGYPTREEWARHRQTCRACQTRAVCTFGDW